MGGPSTNFFQKLIQIHKMWLKLSKIGNNWPILFGYFHVCQVVEHIPDSFRTITFKNETFEKKSKNFISILATIYEVKITFWKKLVEGPPMTYFQIDIFWFYMLWGI
jgi:hypothetical protein